MSSQPASTPSAVFLSYAREDSEAARRIAEALRVVNVEVWFDRNELRGGDAWDAKIRQQIASCALFVPLISANTQARLEGYFRLEWKLAVDRSHLMAEEKPFLVPVVIDETPDATSMVPDRFRAVQWTRLRDGEAPHAFTARVQALLSDHARNETRPRFAPPADAPMRSAANRRPTWLLVTTVVIVSAVVGLIAWPRRERLREGRQPADTSAGESRQRREAREMAERARGHYRGIFTRADLALAEKMGREASELDGTLALAWAVRAGANACHLMRGFVAGEGAQQRAREAQTFAQQALALNRDETEALLALGQVAMFQNAPADAEAFYRRVLHKEPDNSYAHRFLSIVLRSTGRAGEAIDLMQAAVQRFPRDPLTHYDLALAYAYGWNWPRAWEAADASLALTPFPGALMLQVRLAYQWKGDVGLMGALLERVDVTYRGEDDAVVWAMRGGLLARAPARTLEAAGRTARAYLEESFIFPAPKAWFTAHAHRLDRKPGLARQQWQVAEGVIRERLQADPQNLDLRLKLAVTLAWLKETEQARRQLEPIELAWREQLNPERAWDLASFYAAQGDAANAVPLLRQALHAGTGIAPLTLHQLNLDPWWDEIRGTPEFAELLASAPPLPAPVRM